MCDVESDELCEREGRVTPAFQVSVVQQTKGFWRKGNFPLVMLSLRCYVDVNDPLVGGAGGRQFGMEPMGGNEMKWGKCVRRGYKFALAHRQSLQAH